MKKYILSVVIFIIVNFFIVNYSNANEDLIPLIAAAQQGNSKAQFDLGIRYYKGRGVEEDKKQAVKWFKLSADQGYHDARDALKVLGVKNK